MSAIRYRGIADYSAPPSAPLQRLEAAASRNFVAARAVLGLLDTILGGSSSPLFPGRNWSLSEIQRLPWTVRRDAQQLLAWGTGRPIVLNEIIRARSDANAALVRLRKNSPLGRRQVRLANELRRKYPVQAPDDRGALADLQMLRVLCEEVGRPITPGTIRRLLGLAPSCVEIRTQRELWRPAPAERAAWVQLDTDGFTIQQIAMAVSVEKAQHPSVVHGVLEDFFETGTEGVMWAVQDDEEPGYNGLHMIKEGDHLSILDQLGHLLWRGTISCDRKAGWRRYPRNPEYGQPCALGYWIHWTQRGFKPNDWARFFIRPDGDRLRAILRTCPIDSTAVRDPASRESSGRQHFNTGSDSRE